MMPRFFLHLHQCEKYYPDEEGQSLHDLSAARRVAIRDARGLMAEEMKSGRLCLGCRIDIADETGRVLDVIPFKNAVDVANL